MRWRRAGYGAAANEGEVIANEDHSHPQQEQQAQLPFQPDLQPEPQEQPQPQPDPQSQQQPKVQAPPQPQVQQQPQTWDGQMGINEGQCQAAMDDHEFAADLRSLFTTQRIRVTSDDQMLQSGAATGGNNTGRLSVKRWEKASMASQQTKQEVPQEYGVDEQACVEDSITSIGTTASGPEQSSLNEACLLHADEEQDRVEDSRMVQQGSVSGPGSIGQPSQDRSRIPPKGRDPMFRERNDRRDQKRGLKAYLDARAKAQQKYHASKKGSAVQPESQLASADPAASSHGTANPRNLRRARRRAEARGDVLDPVKMDPLLGGCVVLVREDCRLHDNPALYAASEHAWVVPLCIHEDSDPSPRPLRGAGLWWRHESLKVFDQSLRTLQSRIVYRCGCHMEQVVDVLLETGASALYFNRQLEPWYHQRDLEMESFVSERLGLSVKSFKGMVMAFEPWDEKDKSKPKGRLDPVPTVCGRLPPPPDGWPVSLNLEDLGYNRTGGRKIPGNFRQFNEKRQWQLVAGVANPKEDDWAFHMRTWWKMGEAAATARLEEFLKEMAWGCYFPPDLHPRDQAGGRFRADKKWTGLLSPYIRFGDLSARYVYRRCKEVMPHEMSRLFLKRVIWRDKAYAQLFRWPDSHNTSIRAMYETEIWSGTKLALKRWQRGETGYPLVDAAMRQLWKVGWMCNHLRHVTAQFLIEHLDLNWKDGFDWYDYTLVDTDVAINAMMWQMGGHSGIGAWNFVMHPIYAGKKVDPNGAFVRQWLPEIAHLPVEYIHCPWEAPCGVLISANVLVNNMYWGRVIEDLMSARREHQKHVIAVRKQHPHLIDKDGAELLKLSNGKTLHLEVRDDIRENDEDKITLLMTADDPRSEKRRNLAHAKGVHCGIIYDETKRFEAMYDIAGF